MVDNSGSVITSGVKSTIIIPYAATIVGWSIQCDQVATVAIDFFKQAFSTSTIPSVSITGSLQPSVSAAIAATGTTLTGWTTAISANDQIALNVSATGLAGVTRLVVELTITSSS